MRGSNEPYNVRGLHANANSIHDQLSARVTTRVSPEIVGQGQTRSGTPNFVRKTKTDDRRAFTTSIEKIPSCGISVSVMAFGYFIFGFIYPTDQLRELEKAHEK